MAERIYEAKDLWVALRGPARSNEQTTERDGL